MKKNITQLLAFSALLASLSGCDTAKFQEFGEHMPKISLNGPKTLVLKEGESITDPGVIAYDAQDGDLTPKVTISSNIPQQVVPGEYFIEYSVMDSEGHQTTAKRTVRVLPKNGTPSITLKGLETLILKEGESFNDPGAVAFDDQDGDISDKISIFSTVPKTLQPGEYFIEYRVKDSDGMEQRKKRIVKVVAASDIPTITLIGKKTIVVKENETFNDPGAYAYDKQDGKLEISSFSTLPDSMIPGEYFIEYSTEDSDGNKASVRRIVNITSTGTPPEIYLIGAPTLTLKEGDEFKDPGIKVYDKEDGKIENNITTLSTVPQNLVLGDYFIKYTVSDSDGNIAEKTRIVKVVSKTTSGIPWIKILGANPLTISSGADFSEPGFIAYDQEDGFLTNQSIVSKSFSAASDQGEYKVYYSVADKDGHVAEANRTVIIGELVPPTITLLGDDNITLKPGEDFIDPKAVAFDKKDGDITDKIKITKDYNSLDKPGVYHIYYRVTNSKEAIGHSKRTITVKNEVVKNPEIVLIGSQNLSLIQGGDVFDPGALAFSERYGDLSSKIKTHKDFSDTKHTGEYHIYYYVDDGHGHTTSKTRTVNIISSGVQDKKPIINIIGGNVISIINGIEYTDPGATAFDEEDGELTSSIRSTRDFINTSTPGVYHIYYTVSDKAGNITTESRLVLIHQNYSDSHIPEITIAGDNPLHISKAEDYQEYGASATDYKDSDLTPFIKTVKDFNDNSIPKPYPETYHVYYSVVDSDGNFNIASRTVIIEE